jgi:hypothetical protein
MFESHVLFYIYIYIYKTSTLLAEIIETVPVRDQIFSSCSC